MYCRSTVPPQWSYLAQGTTCRPCVPNLWAPPKEDHVGFVWNWVQNPLLKITVFHVSSFSSLVPFLGIPDSCRNHSRFFSCSPISSPSIANRRVGFAKHGYIAYLSKHNPAYVCMYIYIYIFIYLFIHLFIYLFIYGIYVFIYLYVYVYVYVYVYICSTYISCSVIDEQKLNCSSVATWQACGRRVTRLSS